MSDKRSKIIGTILKYIWAIFGVAVYSFAIVFFIRPASIPVGGVSGISLILNNLFNWQMGIVILSLNVPLMLIAYKFWGKQFVASTLICIVANSVFVDVFTATLPTYGGDIYLSILYGGVLMGAGMGIVVNAGCTMGGTEIISKLISKKTDISFGNCNLISAAIIIGAAAICYRNVDSALYAVVAQFVSSRVIDFILHGAIQSDAIFIITEKPEELSHELMSKLGHGVTAVKGKGMYFGTDRYLLICIVHRNQTAEIKNLINTTDPSAFVILTAAKEVYGKDFQHYEE